MDGPKLYLNVVHHERVLPPLNKDKEFADPSNDSTWNVIPIAFTVGVKRKNIENVECWHTDAHVNSCVVEMMRSHQEKFKAIWNYIILRFQHQYRSKFVFHKKSIKISKKKKYKNPLKGNQIVA